MTSAAATALEAITRADDERFARLESKVDRMLKLAESLLAATPPKYVSVEEAARMLGVCKLSVRRKIASNELGAKRLGRRWLVEVAGLRARTVEEVARATTEARG